MPDTPHATTTPTRLKRRPRAAIPADFTDANTQDSLDDVRVLAAVLGTGVSSIYRYVADGRIKKPIKVGRASKWPRRYLRQLAANGIAA